MSGAKGGLIAFLFLVGCAQDVWSPATRDSFVDDCSESGRVYESECQCIQTRIEDGGFLPSDVKNFDSREDSELNDEIYRIMFDCAGT